VGASLLEALQNDYTLLAPSRAELDLRDAGAVRDWLASRRPDAVVHCAVQGEGSSGGLEADLRMFFALAACRPYYGKLVYFGSGAEYDKALPITGLAEDAFGRSLPGTPYGLSKYVMNACARGEDHIVNLRLFSGYGPRENWRVKFISGLCCKALLGLPLSLRRDCLFDFVWVDDIAAAVRWAVETDTEYADYNLSSGCGVRLSEVAAMVKQISGSPSAVEVLNGGQANPYVGDNTRLAMESGLAFTPLERGLARMLEHYAAHLDEIDPGQLSR
jgi:GDP-L-fucose synthase